MGYKFIMPSKFSIDTIPNPINDRIKIIQIPSKRYAVVTFSGQKYGGKPDYAYE